MFMWVVSSIIIVVSVMIVIIIVFVFMFSTIGVDCFCGFYCFWLSVFVRLGLW
jgi:hypothetical protein